MREARIVLPHTNPAQEQEHLFWMRNRLCGFAGGYTETAGYGGWVNPAGETLHEPIAIFDVAIEEQQAGEVITIAYELGRRAGQACVYVRLPNGEVEMVQTEVASVTPLAAAA